MILFPLAHRDFILSFRIIENTFWQVHFRYRAIEKVPFVKRNNSQLFVISDWYGKVFYEDGEIIDSESFGFSSPESEIISNFHLDVLERDLSDVATENDFTEDRLNQNRIPGFAKCFLPNITRISKLNFFKIISFWGIPVV